MLIEYLGHLRDTIYQIFHLFRSWFRRLVVITQIPDISEMLIEAPLRHVNNVSPFQRFIEVSNGRMFFCDLDPVILTDLAEVFFKNDASNGAGSSIKFVLEQLPSCVDLGVEEISLYKLLDFEESALEATLDRASDSELLFEVRNCRLWIGKNLAKATNTQTLKRVFNPIIFEADVFTPFRLLIEAHEVLSSIR